MAYTKRTWVSGRTRLSATNFNHIEDGIETADAEATRALDKLAVQASTISGLVYTVNELTPTVATLTTEVSGLQTRIATLEEDISTNYATIVYVDEKCKVNAAAIEGLTSDLADVKDTADDAYDIANKKQDLLSSGDNISISEDNVISATFDLSAYAKTEDVNTALSNKVDIKEGYDLSQNDFTNELKASVESAVQPSALAAALIPYATIGYVETELNGISVEVAKKVDKVAGKQLSTNDYDNAAKEKVDAIPENPQYTDTKYTAGNGINISDANIITALDAKLGEDIEVKINIGGWHVGDKISKDATLATILRTMLGASDVIRVTDINLSKTALSIDNGTVETLTYTVLPENATDKNVNWSSSDNTVATVSNGKITGIKPGTAVITATAADGFGAAATCEVTVNKVTVTGISLDKTSVSINKNSQAKLTATVMPDNATDKSISWNSSDESIASVNSNGLITANETGNAIITAVSNDNPTITAKCNITVNEEIKLNAYFYTGAAKQTEVTDNWASEVLSDTVVADGLKHTFDCSSAKMYHAFAIPQSLGEPADIKIANQSQITAYNRTMIEVDGLAYYMYETKLATKGTYDVEVIWE